MLEGIAEFMDHGQEEIRKRAQDPTAPSASGQIIKTVFEIFVAVLTLGSAGGPSK